MTRIQALCALPVQPVSRQPMFKAAPRFGDHPSEAPKKDCKETPTPKEFTRFKFWSFLTSVILGMGVAGTAVQGVMDRSSREQDKATYRALLAKHIKISSSLARELKKQVTVGQIMDVAEKVTPATVRIEGSTSLGSGVIISDNTGKLYVLTNGHVTEDNAIAEDGQELYSIKLYNGTDFKEPFEFKAKHIKTADGQKAESMENDLALLEIPKSVKLPGNVKPIPLRDTVAEPIRVGEVVVAVGNPEGLRDSVTSGIVSHVDRAFDLEPANIFLQTDAPINPGNSGGGLFDMQGRLIGINTLKYMGSDGLGGAIRIDVVKKVLEGWGVPINPTHRQMIGNKSRGGSLP